METHDEKLIKRPRLFFLTGENSGDLLASEAIKKIQAKNHHIEIQGVCGERMRAQGVFEMCPMEKFQTIFPDSVIRMPILYWHFLSLKRAILKFNPDICVFVDASWLSLKMASGLRSLGYRGKIIKYVCPSMLWPDGGRKKIIETMFDQLISIFPKEKETFLGSKLKVNYVGHPLMDRFSLAEPAQSTLSVFPGSRIIIVKNVIHSQLAVCESLQEKHPSLKIFISCAAPYLEPIILKAIAQHPKTHVQIVHTSNEKQKHDLFKNTRVALTIPGTINLELAKFAIPSLIAFPCSILLQKIGLMLWGNNIKYHALMNRLHRGPIFPELLISKRFTVSKCAEILNALFWDEKLRAFIRKECEELCLTLCNPDPKIDAASIILEAFETL